MIPGVSRLQHALHRRRELLILLFIATACRLLPGAWLALGVDDGVSLLTASRPIGEILPGMLNSHEVHPPLYFYYLHPWVAWLSPGGFTHGGLEAWFHLSSLPWALLVVYLTWRLGGELGGPRVGLVAGLLVAVSDYVLYYALEVRMYQMLSALVLGAAWAAHTRSRWAFVACCSLAFLTHYIAIFFILALALYGAWDLKGRRFVVAPLVVGVLVALWSPVIVHQMGGQAFSLRESPSWAQALELFFELGFGVTWPVPLPGWTPGGLPVVKWMGQVTLGLMVWGLACAGERPRRLLGCMVVVPLFLVFAVSNATPIHIFEYKYFQPLAPFFCIALAMLARPVEGQRALKPPGFWVVVAVLGVNLVAWAGFVRAADWYGPQPWGSLVRQAAWQLGADDFIVVHPSMMVSPVLIYSFLEAPEIASRVVGADAPENPQLISVFTRARRIWLWTTPSHPFVRQQRLLERLPAGWRARFIGETDNYWPANRIEIYLLEGRSRR